MKRVQFSFFTVETLTGVDYFTDIYEAIDFLNTICLVDAERIQLELQKNSTIQNTQWRLNKVTIKGVNDGSWFLIE